MKLPLIKICGLTSFEDTQAAIESGADWLGFIFVPESPRALSVEMAESFLHKIKQCFPNSRLVGVFKDAPVEEIQRHLDRLPLDAIQLHGNENAEQFMSIKVSIIKVLVLNAQTTIAELQRQAEVWAQMAKVETFLLDLPKGSGLCSVLEWPAFCGLGELTDTFPCVIAGGLNSDNVVQVIEALCPFAVDVASGVEQSPGKKNVALMQNFCRAVKTFQPLTDSGESIPCNR